jgi:hypothetical protein
MTFHNAAIVTMALLVTFMLTSCAGIRPTSSDPDYADWVRCGGPQSTINVFGFFGVSDVSGKVRACMDRNKEQRAADEAMRAAREEEAQRRAERVKEESAALAKENAEIAERKQEWEKERRRACGNNYGKLRVGMTLDRVKQCWPRFGWFRLTGEINRADGVVSIYSMPIDNRGSLAYAISVSEFYVMKGKVVGWTR